MKEDTEEIEMEWEGLTADILAAAIKVQKSLGPGLLEATYRSCLAYELGTQGHRVEEEVGLSVHYGSLLLPNAYRMDLVVDGPIVVELKALEKLLPVHEAQLVTYLRFSRKPIGLLQNFWAWPMKAGGIKRIIETRHPSRSDFVAKQTGAWSPEPSLCPRPQAGSNLGQAIGIHPPCPPPPPRSP